MTAPHLFAPDLQKWVDAQMQALGLTPCDELYANARQAAEQGWAAASIRVLLWPASQL